MNKRMAIVVPCFNEEQRLQQHKFLAFVKEHSFVDLWFVNDGSADNTQGVLLNMQTNAAEQIFVLQLEQNSGKAEAVRKGVLAAINKGNYQYVGFLDADLSAPLKEVILVFQSFIEDDNLLIAAGSRVKILGREIERSAMRHYFSRIFVTFYSTLLQLPNYDTQCGLKIFSSTVAGKIFQQEFVSKWMFDTELFLRAMILLGKADYMTKVREIPLNEWREVGGSKLKMMDFIKAPFEILKIKKAYQKSHNTF